MLKQSIVKQINTFIKDRLDECYGTEQDFIDKVQKDKISLDEASVILSKYANEFAAKYEYNFEIVGAITMDYILNKLIKEFKIG